jgi:hypothetical protein
MCEWRWLVAAQVVEAAAQLKSVKGRKAVGVVPKGVDWR